MRPPNIPDRDELRHVISPRAKGKLASRNSQKSVQVLTVDVSRRGLGLFVDQFIQPGTLVRLSVLGQPIDLEVAWCQNQDEKTEASLLRCGLCSLDPESDLLALFNLAGCSFVKENQLA